MTNLLGLRGSITAPTCPHWRNRIISYDALVVEACWWPLDGTSTGDFCQVTARPDGTVGIVLADAPGSGHEAAPLARTWSAAAAKELRAGRSPAEVLSVLDRAVTAHGPDLLATGVCVIINPTLGVAELSNAGHPAPILAGGGNADPIPAPTDAALGIGAAHHTERVNLVGDHALYVVTDGMIERRNRPLWSGWDVLIETAKMLAPGRANASGFARTVTDQLGEPQDDATVLTLRLTGTETARAGSSCIDGSPNAERRGARRWA